MKVMFLLISIIVYTLDYVFGSTSPCGCHAELGYYDLTGDLYVVGCHGTFWGGMDDLSVDTICGNGYHVCDSAQEATDLGLTHSQCSGIIPDGKLFFARESSNGNGRCDSVYNTNGGNDVWGCSSNNSWTNVCNFLPGSYSDCLSMSVFCWSFNGGTIYDTYGTTPVIEFGSDGDNEYNNMEISNPNYGGVLCCKDDTQQPPPPPPRVSQCYECAEPCNKLTEELGCANNECLDNCKYCISDIAWYDYDGGQDNRCQCHNNGCDQCEDGWFKLDYDFPCQECSKLPGCLHCSDFLGCQQCEYGYTLTEHPTCGENSLLNTGNAKFHYCKPNDGSDCDGDGAPPGPRDDGCSLNLGKCDSDPCECMMDSECNDCQNYGCETCDDGYFKKSFGYECVECRTAIDNCRECSDWQGCTKCNYGYKVEWDNDCGVNVCVANPFGY